MSRVNPGAAAATTPASSGGGGSSWAGGSGGFQFIGGDTSGLFSGSLAGIANSYTSSYNAALQMNAELYNQIMAGYSNTAQNLANTQKGITQGYNTLTSQVLGQLNGSNQSNIQAINDYYANQMGAAQQNLISSGLNNSTVAQSVQRGVALDQAKAVTGSNNQFAQLYANYQSQLGLAGLSYQNTAAEQQLGLAQNQLQWENSIQVPYPDPQAYMQAYSNVQQNQQFQQDYGLESQLLNKAMKPISAPGGGFSGVYGQTSSAGGYTPSYGTTGYVPMTGAGGGASGYTPGGYSYAYSPTSSYGTVGGGGYGGLVGLGNGEYGGYSYGDETQSVYDE